MSDSTQRPAQARALGDGDLGVWVSVADRGPVKALPGARWDPGLKCWRVPIAFKDEAEAVVERLNSKIDPIEVALTDLIGRLPVQLGGPTLDSLSNAWWQIPRLSQILARVRDRYDLDGGR